METPLIVATGIVLGLIIGSFLTVVVDRVPRGGSVVAPPSACGSCGRRLTVADLVPILSWLVLRGRCRTCGNRIGIEPVVLEVANTAVFVAFALEFGADPVLPAFWILGAALVALVCIDLREFRLPREISYTAFVMSAAVFTIAALTDGEPDRLWRPFVGAAIATAVMGLIHLGSRGGLGDGDVRLAPLLGLHLGHIGLAVVPVGLFLGFLFGALVGLGMIAAGRAGRTTPLPFGPFLAAGTLVAVFVGTDLVDLVWVT